VLDRHKLVADADVVLAVQPPPLDVVSAMKEGAILVSFIYANKEPALVKLLLEKKITCFAMEKIPRITRAQAMDALSSQAALAGYYAVLLGATQLGRVIPKMTTAAGTVGPAKVLVMGLGVAGLEALATAHRLGAVVEGYDVRPDTAEQAKSLGATFVDTGVDARGEGGYARELTAEEKVQGRFRSDQAHPGGRSHHHHGRHPRSAVAQTDQQGAGRRNEGRRRHRRPLCGGGRQLRGYQGRARPRSWAEQPSWPP
jgi:NAD(P) transhydrogenase subunit alpha